MKIINNKNYYTPQDVADMFGVTKESVIGWIKIGKLKCNKISPKKFLITDDQLEQYVNLGKQI